MRTATRIQKSKVMPKVIYFISLSLIFLSVVGCGSQDYGDELPRSFSQVFSELLPQVEKQKNAAPEVLFGADANDENLCPLDAICLRAAYFGPPQWKWLASERGDFVHEVKNDEQVHFKIQTDRRIIVEAIFVEASAVNKIFVCSKDILVSALAFGGGGIFDGSGEVCNRPEGTPIQVLSVDIGSVSVSSNGRKGERGLPPNIPPGERRARDGDSLKSKFEIIKKETPTKLCISSGACGGTYEESLLKMKANLTWLKERNLFSVEELRLFVWEQLLKGKYGAKFWTATDPIEYSDSLMCHFQADGEDKTPSLFESATMNVSDFESLNGEPSMKAWAGAPGSPGGTPGSISVVTSKAPPPAFQLSSLGGEGGEPGPVIPQTPGKGMSPDKKTWPLRIENQFRIHCSGGMEYSSKRTENGKVIEEEKFSVTHPGFETRRVKTYDFIFGLGKPRTFDLLNGLNGEKLLSEDARGLDGASFNLAELTKMQPAKGPKAADIESQTFVINDRDSFLSDAKKRCPSCQVFEHPKNLLPEVQQ